MRAALIAGLCALVCASCGTQDRDRSVAADPSAPIPTPIGVGPRFQPSAHAGRLGGRRHGFECRPGGPGGDTAHLELFAEGRVVLIPDGIGLGPPVHRGLQRIVSARCRYPVAAFDRTGVVDFTREGLTLGDLFGVWGEPLSRVRLASFHARAGEEVHAYVAGVPWRADVRDVPLTHHAEIVLEVDGFIPPHATYLFPR
jgi:hypothetical protein